MYYHIDRPEKVNDHEYTHHLIGGTLADDAAVRELLGHPKARPHLSGKPCFWSGGNAPMAVLAAKIVVEVAERHQHALLLALGRTAEFANGFLGIDEKEAY